MPNSAGLSEPETFPVFSLPQIQGSRGLPRRTDRVRVHASSAIYTHATWPVQKQEDVDEIQRQFFLSFVTHDSGGDEQRAYEFEKAAAILSAQVPHRNKLWMSSIVSRDIGGDVGQFVADIGRFERTSHARDPTWARPGDKEGRLHIQNTMGYQVKLDPD
ncbi:hypothetical protein DFH08DRAFT_804127 [Mycena albidolilacea]|uniref:Uncharacterized protein n=1 Tax=Mycena albidolilacea TaxID=1033008 RepID=A0AAD7EWR3_9AGAR|nr:hypothetical protein DFH08DRAFT_804127 [Mycena albidolilacea]